MIAIGNLAPLRAFAEDLAAWEGQVRARPLPESDPVVQALATIRQQLAAALDEAQHLELELSATQYAALRGCTPNALYKKWQRGQLPEARMRGGKLVVPASALMDHAA